MKRIRFYIGVFYMGLASDHAIRGPHQHPILDHYATEGRC
jgi:hypothetical protein